MNLLNEVAEKSEFDWVTWMVSECGDWGKER